MKLLWKMLIPILVLIVVLMGVAGFISYRQAADSLQASVVENLRGEAEALKRTTTIVLGESLHSVRRLAADPAVLQFFQGDTADKNEGLALADTLGKLLKTYPALDRVNVFNLNGDIVSSSSADVIGNNFAAREYFTAAAKGEDFVSAPFVSAITKQGMLIVSTPITMNNAVVGVINATIGLPGYYETAVKPVRVSKTGYAFAIDAKGQIVAHSRPELLFRDDIPPIAAYREMANSPDGSRELINVSGKEAFAYHIKEPFSSMTLVIQAEQAEVFSALNELATNAVIVVVIASILAAVTLWMLVRPVVKALNKGVVYAADIAGGNLNSTLDVKARAMK